MSTDGVPFSHPWEELLVKDLAYVIVGGTPHTSVPQFWGGSVPWMSSGDIHLKRIVDVPGRLTEEGLGSSNAKLVSPPAVAVALAGQGKTRGTAALTLVTLCTNQSVALIKARDGRLRAEYLYHMLTFRYEELRARSAGGGRAGLSKRLIEAIPVPLPCPDEQEEIAAILDSLDAEIGQTEALIAKYQRIKTGLMHDLLTRGIDENGNLRRPDTHQFRDSSVGRIPIEWDVITLSEALLSNPQNGIYKPASAIGRGTLLVGQTSITDLRSIDFSLARRVVLTVNELKSYALQYEDILVSRVFATVDGVGQPVLVPELPESAVFESNMMRLRVDRTVIAPALLFHWLRSAPIRKRVAASVNASNQTSINQKSLGLLPVVIPPTSEQTHLLSVLQVLDEHLKREKVYLQKTRLLKLGLMQDLLTGKVRLRRCCQQTKRETHDRHQRQKGPKTQAQ